MRCIINNISIFNKNHSLTTCFFSFQGIEVSRIELGLPMNWQETANTLNRKPIESKHYIPKSSLFKKKCPEIQKLDSYDQTPPPNFWKTFPKHKNLTDISTPVNVKKLKKLVEQCKDKWSIHEQKIAEKTLKNLSQGTTSKFREKPNKIDSKNSQSAIFYGELITDSIAYWLKKKFIAGPFSTPPFENTCCSPLMANKQKNKIRPILNLSSPEGGSVNDLMEDFKFRKLEMSSAQKFGQTLLLAGKNATFAKTDLQDAYKLLPCSFEEKPFFGFKWLDKYFIDISTPFGSKAAPSNFDDFGETITNIAKTISKTEKKWIQRQLDDVPIVSPVNSNITENFSKTYKNICEILNIPVAENCIHFEKAFDATTNGTVLGVEFDSKKLSWKLPNEKTNETIQLLNETVQKSSCSLLEFQKLHGKLNDFAQMHRFMKGFKFNQNNFIKSFQNNTNERKQIPVETKLELTIWEKNLLMCENGMAIPVINKYTPFVCKHFISDAAGPKIVNTLSGGLQVCLDEDSGFASVQYEGEKVTFCCKNTWSKKFLTKFQSKSAIFEMIGLLAPFIAKPKKLIGKRILLEVDNITCVFAWEKRTAKHDPLLAILVQTLHILEAALPCKIYVEHVKRRSNPMSILVDNLSRTSSTKKPDLEKLKNIDCVSLTGPLLDWTNEPIEDWSLPKRIVDWVIQKTVQ